MLRQSARVHPRQTARSLLKCAGRSTRIWLGARRPGTKARQGRCDAVSRVLETDSGSDGGGTPAMDASAAPPEIGTYLDGYGEVMGDCPRCGHAGTITVKGDPANRVVAFSCYALCRGPKECVVRSGNPLPERRSRMSASSPWTPIDLHAVLRRGLVGEPPHVLERSDGTCLLYRGKLHSISGEPETGKGWAVMHAVQQTLSGGARVVYLDFEDTAETFVSRLVALGVPETAFDQVAYFPPATTHAGLALDVLDGELALGPALAVIDGVTEALAWEGLDLQSNADVAKWFTMVPRRLAASGAAVVMVDHVTKDRLGRGRFAIGAQHKLAGVDVAFTLESTVAFGRGHDGVSTLHVQKDRPGYLREHAHHSRIGELRLVSHADGAVTVVLDPPATAGSSRQDARLGALMERVSLALEEAPGLSKKSLRRSVTGNNAAKDDALARLIRDANVRVEQDGQAMRHFCVRPFRQAASLGGAPVPKPCPPRAQAPSECNGAPVPLPIGATGTGHDMEDPTP